MDGWASARAQWRRVVGGGSDGRPRSVTSAADASALARLFVCLFFCLFICLFVYLFVCLFVYLFNCLIVYLFDCLFVYLFDCLFV